MRIAFLKDEHKIYFTFAFAALCISVIGLFSFSSLKSSNQSSTWVAHTNKVCYWSPGPYYPASSPGPGRPE